jgi:hypothetical protein
MIIINLLPPEMRKKHGNTNPVIYLLAACYFAALIPAGTWAWLKYDRLPHAKAVLEEANADLEMRTAAAAKVEALEAQIAEFQAHRDMIVGLLARKIFWARTIDDFANHLDGPGGMPWKGFEVCCTELNILPSSGGSVGKAKDALVTSGVRGRYKLVGVEADKAGDYVRDFLIGTESTKFWSVNGFVGKPELSYRGDTPDWKKGIERVTVEFTLDWSRTKRIASSAKPATGGM